MVIKAIETHYAGYKFRSRLEARWAVLLTRHGVPWHYETEGYVIERAGGSTTRYLPDFLLPECGTWLEVKGVESELDKELMIDAAAQLPQRTDGGEAGPVLMALGPIPWAHASRQHDWGWVGLDRDARGATEARYGFGAYHKNRRPWFLDNATNDAARARWLTPVLDTSEGIEGNAYAAARAARFEHGEQG